MTENTVDLAMNWQSCVGIFVALIENGTAEGRRNAIAEMKRMAWLADHAFKPLEIYLAPIAGDTLADRRSAITGFDVVLRLVDGDPIEEHEDLTEAKAEDVFFSLQERFPQAHVTDLRGLIHY